MLTGSTNTIGYSLDRRLKSLDFIYFVDYSLNSNICLTMSTYLIVVIFVNLLDNTPRSNTSMMTSPSVSSSSDIETEYRTFLTSSILISVIFLFSVYLKNEGMSLAIILSF